MLKRFLSVLIVVLLLNMVGVIPAYGRSQGDAQVPSQKVKEAIVKRGTGESAKVELTLSDGRKLKGYVREADQDTFVVVDPKTGTATTVAYLEVKEIKGSKFFSGARIGLGVAAAVGIGVALSIVLAAVLFHGD